ncbi:S-adenosyl-L-methionine-dependent methyltransferase [Peniophora sp. CONT]|nr:S-adenosyl-L-methionine-dependent methyltransferase [Peniophora sp. CONT]
MTFSTLRALQAIIADGIDTIERAYAEASEDAMREESGSRAEHTSPETPPPSPPHSRPAKRQPATVSLDYPSLDAPGDQNSYAEKLASHPAVLAAASRVVSAANQLATVLRLPFLTLCDAGLGYHLPSCLGFFEAAHIPELLREAGKDGMHAETIGKRINVDASRTSHILRLLATQHILREVKPDVFALNRVSTLLDSGKPFNSLQAGEAEKYDGQGQTAAFFALNADELFKTSAYMTDFLLPRRTKAVASPLTFSDGSFTSLLPPATITPSLTARQRDRDDELPTSLFPTADLTPMSPPTPRRPRVLRRLLSRSVMDVPRSQSPSSPVLSLPQSPSSSRKPSLASLALDLPPPMESDSEAVDNMHRTNATTFNLAMRTQTPYWGWLELPENKHRLARFGRAMGGSAGWEGAAMDALCGEPFPSLLAGSLVIDVGGGIGSASMRLAQRFPTLRLMIQDRAPVCRHGEEAWRAKMPEALDSARVRFQAHDFFTPQPASLGRIGAFLVRVVLHDWTDIEAVRILRRLRASASLGSEDESPTYLVIGEHILPYANTSEREGENPETKSALDGLDAVEGAEEALRLTGATWPLLANLGTASANAYWMDMTMQTIFNGQERTLPELVTLCLSAGWKVTRATRVPGSTFGHIVAVPTVLPPEDVADAYYPGVEVPRPTSPVIIDPFGSSRRLPSPRTPAHHGRRGSLWSRWIRNTGLARDALSEDAR